MFFLFSLKLLSETFLILRRTKRDIIVNVHTSSRKVAQIQIFMKIRSVGTALLLTYGRTDRWTDRHRERERDRQTDGELDMTKLMIAFRNFANVSKNWLCLLVTKMLIKTVLLVLLCDVELLCILLCKYCCIVSNETHFWLIFSHKCASNNYLSKFTCFCFVFL